MRQALITAGTATIFSAGLTLPVRAADGSVKLAVKETRFKFREPLVRRSRTDAIIIHHVGGTDQEVPAAKIHQWHLANKWAGIGYHYVIHKDGTVERGRPMNAVGAHCYAFVLPAIMNGRYRLMRLSHPGRFSWPIYVRSTALNPEQRRFSGIVI